MSAISDPTGPHGSLLVAVQSQLADTLGSCARGELPLRTLTSTAEYPLVTFLTLRTTFDMVAARGDWSADQGGAAALMSLRMFLDNECLSMESYEQLARCTVGAIVRGRMG